MPCHPNAVHSSSGTGRDSKWDQDAKNCRAPALDFLASIVTNSGPDVHALPGVIGISGAIGVGLGGVISESGLRKSDSTKSFASQSSASSSADSKKTPFDGDFINRNGKRTPCESPAPETKLLKVESSISSKMMTIPEGTNGGGNQSAIFSNLPMPAGQIPHMNNNGQFNQSFLLEQSGHMSDANTQNFVLANQVPGVAEGQKLREDMTFPYYTQQQSLVYPVSSFSSGPGGSNAVEQATE